MMGSEKQEDITWKVWISDITKYIGPWKVTNTCFATYRCTKFVAKDAKCYLGNLWNIEIRGRKARSGDTR